MRSKARNCRYPSTHKGSFMSLVDWFCVFLCEGLGKVGVELGYGERNLEKMC